MDRMLSVHGGALLALVFLGLLCGGLRNPWAWTAAAAAVWGLGLAGREGSGWSRASRWAPWVLWAGASLALSGQPWNGLYAFARWTTLVFFYGLASAAADPLWRERWFWGLAACAPALALASVLIRSPNGTMTGLIPPYYNYTMFVQGAFLAAAAAALGHPQGPKGRARALAAAGAALALGVILFSRSRGALAAAAAAAAIWAATSGRGRALLWAGAVLAAAGLAAPEALRERVLKLDLAEWFTRPQIWAGALAASADHPWLGEGVGNFASAFNRHNFPKGWLSNYGFTADHAHSEPLEILVETGWPGLILFAAALAAGLRRRAGGWAAEAAFFASLAMLFHGLVDNMLQLPALGLLFFSALACAGPQAPVPAPLARPAWALACSLGLGLALAGALPRALRALTWQRLAEEGAPEARLGWLEKLERLSPSDEYVHVSRARALASLDPPRPREALAALARARSLNPTNAYHPQLQAELAAEQGAWEEALAFSSEAVRLEPNFLGARLLRAEALLALGRVEEARAELAELGSRRESARGWPAHSDFDRGLVALDEGRLTRAARQARPAGPPRPSRRSPSGG